MQRDFHLSKAVINENLSFVPTLWVQSILSSWTRNDVQKQDERTMVEVMVEVMEEVMEENLDEMTVMMIMDENMVMNVDGGCGNGHGANR